MALDWCSLGQKESTGGDGLWEQLSDGEGFLCCGRGLSQQREKALLFRLLLVFYI